MVGGKDKIRVALTRSDCVFSQDFSMLINNEIQAILSVKSNRNQSLKPSPIYKSYQLL